MKKYLIIFFALICLKSFADVKHDSKGFLLRDTLVVVSGLVTVNGDSYFLDVNNDNTADYFLDFGPIWYVPDDTTLTKPAANSTAKIEGVLTGHNVQDLPRLVVCYINDLTWRIPYSSKWNHLGEHSPYPHMGECVQYGYDWNTSLQEVNLNGTVLVDTTLGYKVYYIDSDNDGNPDYFLNFGPPWFKSVSGGSFPNAGDVVTVRGGYRNDSPFSTVLVYDLNGSNWVDQTFNPNIGSGWLFKEIASPVTFHSPFDPLDKITFQPGWKPGQTDHQGVHDTIYIQMLERDPKGVPGIRNHLAFAAYETNIFYPDGSSPMMNGEGYCGIHIHLVTDIQYQFHYTDEQLEALNIDENTIRARFWYDHDMKWDAFLDQVLDVNNNTITVAKNTVLSLTILTGTRKTVDVNEPDAVVKEFRLEQNYPNPFNPSTTINYSIPVAGNVKLTLFDVLGKEIAVLINQNQNAGNFQYSFDVNKLGNLSSGIYFYELKVTSAENTNGNFVSTKKLILMK